MNNYNGVYKFLFYFRPPPPPKFVFDRGRRIVNPWFSAEALVTGRPGSGVVRAKSRSDIHPGRPPAPWSPEAEG